MRRCIEAIVCGLVEAIVEVNADKSIDLIGRVKSTNITKFTNNTCFLLSQATQAAPTTSIWYFIL